MGDPKPIGHILDQLEVVCDWDEAEIPLDAVVVLRAYDPQEGQHRMAVCYSPKTDFIVRRGMVELARDFEQLSSGEYVADEDDEL